MKQDKTQSLEKEVRSAAFNNSNNRETRTVTLDVTPGYYGRFRKLHIYLNEDSFLTSVRLNRKQQIEIEIPSDALYLFGEMDWVTTEKIDLKGLQNGDVIKIVSAGFSEILRSSFRGMLRIPPSLLSMRFHIKIFLDRKTR